MRIGFFTAAALLCAASASTPLVPALAAEEAVETVAVREVTLQQLLKEAIERSPKLQAKRRRYEATRARVLSAWLPGDPEAGADVEGQSALFRFDRTDNEFMVSQSIPFPTTLWLRGRVALREADIAYQEYRETQRDVLWHIEQPYHELLLARKAQRSLSDIRSLLERMSASARSHYQSNEGSQQDVLKIQIEASKARIELFQWQEKEHLAEAHVSHILNEPLDTTRAIREEPRSAPLVLSREELERSAARIRPELKAMELAIQRAKANQLLAATTWLPDITGRVEARHFAGESGLQQYDTFLGVTVPVWSFVKGIGGQWKGAARDVQVAEAEYLEAKNEVLLAVHEAYSKITSAEYALDTYEQSIIPQSRQQVEVAIAAYESGRSDLLSLLDAQRTLKDAQLVRDRLAADYELGLAQLRLAVGDDLEVGDERQQERIRP